MSWNRLQHSKTAKRPQHVRVSLCVAACMDCGRPLQVTHLVDRFGGRCRPCFSVFWSGAQGMAHQFA